MGLALLALTILSKEEYHLPFYPPYYSQCGQDKYLHERVFLKKKISVFVEIGAHDGIIRSNTCFFEKNLEALSRISPKLSSFNTYETPGPHF